MEKIESAVIGAGAVGLAVALELLSRGDKEIFVFEKNSYLAEGQSGRNSGVIHAGIYHNAGWLKTRLCVEGNPLLYDFCAKNGVACANTGKLIVAATAEELSLVEELYDRARENGARSVRMIGPDEVCKLEPNVRAVGALYSPSTGCIDAAGYVKTLARAVENRGAQIIMEADVVSVEPLRDAFILGVKRSDGRIEEIIAQRIINAAGLRSDTIAKMVDGQWSRRILPLRGEYYKFNRMRRSDIQMKGLNVYPAPERVVAGGVEALTVGIHLTPTFDILNDGSMGIGNIVIVGPEFVSVEDREDYKTGRKPVEIFYEKVRRFFPHLKTNDLEMDFAGIMVNMGKGTDWIIERDGNHSNCLNLVNLDSPALTSSLAIAKYAVRI